MNQKTINKLKANPFYKPTPDQLVPDEEEEIKTFGIVPAQNTSIPKHLTGPNVVVHKNKK